MCVRERVCPVRMLYVQLWSGRKSSVAGTGGVAAGVSPSLQPLSLQGPRTGTVLPLTGPPVASTRTSTASSLRPRRTRGGTQSRRTTLRHRSSAGTPTKDSDVRARRPRRRRPQGPLRPRRDLLSFPTVASCGCAVSSPSNHDSSSLLLLSPPLRLR